VRPTESRRRFAAVAIGVLATVALAACGSSSSSGSSSSAPGVTGTSITFGTHQPLTGPAAPGYDEIAAASAAYFNYVNAHGGVFGRKIHLIVKDDAYNPTNTVNVVHQLVLQSNVFGIYEGLGTPTHTKVVGFLNASKIPDLFVASGCPCWDNGTTQPYTFGWQPNYTIEGKILGQYIKQHFAGKKIGVLYQDDDFGQGGLAGIQDEVGSSIVSKQPYQPGTTSLATQITAIKSSGAQVLVDFTVPIYTAIGQLTAFTLHYTPQLVISSVGIDPTTVGGLLKTISKGKASGTALIEGAITDGYLPSNTDTSNPWIQLFMKVHSQYDSSAPVFDGNVEYGMASAYTLVQALKAAGKNLTRQDLINAVNNDGGSWKGPGLVPFRYTKTQHGGYGGAEMGKVQGGKIVLFGGPLTTDPTAGSPITTYSGTQPAPPTDGIPTN
jgi:ABC-type branched-subunit amino acid transport system substrate-binding protein